MDPVVCSQQWLEPVPLKLESLDFTLSIPSGGPSTPNSRAEETLPIVAHMALLDLPRRPPQAPLLPMRRRLHWDPPGPPSVF